MRWHSLFSDRSSCLKVVMTLQLLSDMHQTLNHECENDNVRVSCSGHFFYQPWGKMSEWAHVRIPLSVLMTFLSCDRHKTGITQISEEEKKESLHLEDSDEDVIMERRWHLRVLGEKGSCWNPNSFVVAFFKWEKVWKCLDPIFLTFSGVRVWKSVQIFYITRFNKGHKYAKGPLL